MISLIRKMLSLFIFLLLAATATALPATSPAPLPPASQPPAQTPAPETASSPAWTAMMAAQPPAPTQNEFRPADGPPDYDVLIPADPNAAPRPTADLAEYGLTQITYWSCATIAAATQCGWHRPLVPVSAAPSTRDFGLGAVFALAGVATALLLL
ncbi:hypothetical protein F5X68DRAFT_3858 [Plectosphaerella plurivora]|uniref:Uncharacterized protein n=1 Tax=Plectosphaerella plurivora TaxID=936078 RepID=A0A9P8VPG1_9PEZI|nr:hypothetical protein F5X68DRAFT_3858 [Plectosphaerella plurivora]